MWFFENVGKRKCSLVDTYWQTETGGIILTTLPHAMPMKPGSAGLPFFGISVGLVDSQSGTEITGNDVEGVLVVKKEWPSIARYTFIPDLEQYLEITSDTFLHISKLTRAIILQGMVHTEIKMDIIGLEAEWMMS